MPNHNFQIVASRLVLSPKSVLEKELWPTRCKVLHAKVIDNDFCGLNSIKFLKDLRYQLVLRRSQRNSDKRLPGVSWALALVEDCVEAILSRRFFRGDSKLFRRGDSVKAILSM